MRPSWNKLSVFIIFLGRVQYLWYSFLSGRDFRGTLERCSALIVHIVQGELRVTEECHSMHSYWWNVPLELMKWTILRALVSWYLSWSVCRLVISLPSLQDASIFCPSTGNSCSFFLNYADDIMSCATHPSQSQSRDQLPLRRFIPFTIK